MADPLTADALYTPVLTATASLMSHRLREDGFTSPTGGEEVGAFTENTRPTLAQATEVTRRAAEAFLAAYPSATTGDAAQMATAAALWSAVQLEGAAYPEQVSSERSPARLWLDMLALIEAALNGTIGDPAGASARLAPAWGFGVCDDRVPGAECPWPETVSKITCGPPGCGSRRLAW